MSLDHAERLARLRLIRTETIGPITFYRLIARYGSAVKTLEKLPDFFAKSNRGSPPIIFPYDAAMVEINSLKSFGGRMVMFGDDDYPQWLSTVEDAPPVLSIKGNSELLSRPSIAIVGARNASANAKKFTHTLSQDLGKKGQIIVSGLARGIDTYAHLASLETVKIRNYFMILQNKDASSAKCRLARNQPPIIFHGVTVSFRHFPVVL